MLMKRTINNPRAVVPLKSLLEDSAFRESKAALPVAIGRDAEGNPKVIDLAEAPHILMAGATKQGKTTAVHSLILSLLRSRTSDEVKFVFIDPKGCELTAYKTLSGFFFAGLPDIREKETILTTTEEAEKVLHSLCLELEMRFGTFASYKVDDISRYNAKAKEEGRGTMPYIVVVIDEYADFLTFPRCDRKSKEISSDIMSHIVDLAYEGRAAGIHLVITTCRGSSKVISEVIKDNIPTRMAFRCISRIDSRNIIGHYGAESLNGRGDMLLKYGGEITRIQGAYAGGEDIAAAIQRANLIDTDILLADFE